MNERWADIAGYEGLYRVSNQGHVQSSYSGAWKQMSPAQIKTGYLCILLCREGKRKNRRISQLVAQAFVPNPEGKPEVNHKDANKLNNDASNLEWVTHMENMRHALRLGLLPQGEKHGASKLTRIQVQEIREVYALGNHSQLELAEQFGVSGVAIGYIVNRVTWTHI